MLLWCAEVQFFACLQGGKGKQEVVSVSIRRLFHLSQPLHCTPPAGFTGKSERAAKWQLEASFRKGSLGRNSGEQQQQQQQELPKGLGNQAQYSTPLSHVCISSQLSHPGSSFQHAPLQPLRTRGCALAPWLCRETAVACFLAQACMATCIHCIMPKDWPASKQHVDFS